MPRHHPPSRTLRRFATSLALAAPLSAAHAETPAYLSDTPPAVAAGHQKRIDSAWKKSAEGASIGTNCAFFGALVENPFGTAALTPQQEADAFAAQEVCYVQGFSRSIHYFLRKQPDQCRRLSNRMATAHGLALSGLKDEAKRKALNAELDANIGDLVRQHCPKEASLILDL